MTRPPAPPSDPPVAPLERVLQALSDPVRLGIVRQLHRDGECSCAALDAGRPKSTMSHHFRILREAGLVRTRAAGTTHLNTLCAVELETAYPGLLAVLTRPDHPGPDAPHPDAGA